MWKTGLSWTASLYVVATGRRAGDGSPVRSNIERLQGVCQRPPKRPPGPLADHLRSRRRLPPGRRRPLATAGGTLRERPWERRSARRQSVSTACGSTTVHFFVTHSVASTKWPTGKGAPVDVHSMPKRGISSRRGVRKASEGQRKRTTGRKTRTTSTPLVHSSPPSAGRRGPPLPDLSPRGSRRSPRPPAVRHLQPAAPTD